MPRAPKTKRRRRHHNPHRDPAFFTQAGPVTITRADGSVTVHDPLDAMEYQELVRDRSGVTPALRVRVFRRDGNRCRYCRSCDGPFELDHVVPVSMGGSSRMSNLVVACRRCNQRKGANVWKPLPLAA